MKPSERRKKYSEQLRKRTEESYATRDSSGKFKGILDTSSMQGVTRWKPSSDDHSINIIPFLAGKNNPTKEEGDIVYWLDVYTHRAIGVNEDTYLCVNRTFAEKKSYKGNRNCPICNYIAAMKKTEDYDEEALKALAPSRRAIYNIHVLDNQKEKDKGIQIWDVSHYLFEKELAELAKKKQGGGFIYFSDPGTDGKIVSFRKKGEGRSTKYSALSFEDRDEPISDELLDAAICLDDYLVIPTEEEVEAAFFGNKATGEDNDTTTHDDTSKAETGEAEGAESGEADGTDVGDGNLECPLEGVTFGVDFNEYQNCDDCKLRQACEEEHDAIEAVAKEKEEAEARAKAEEEEKKKQATKEKEKPQPRNRQTQTPPPSTSTLKRRVR